MDAVRGDYGGNDYADLMAAVDYALEHYDFIDQDRLGVTGGSYGGFMTNWIVGHTNRFKAAVTQRSFRTGLALLVSVISAIILQTGKFKQDSMI